MEAYGGQREISAAVYRECPDGIRNLVDEILTLNRVEVEVFCRHLQQRLAITDEMNSGAADGGAAPAGETKDAFDVKINSFKDGSKIKIIKEVRAATGMGLKEAKELVDSVPAVVKKDMARDEAEALLQVITEAGGIAEVL
eukprot:GSChrysophyteH1.ASY1.ANO1.2370.1 assembled CDS